MQGHAEERDSVNPIQPHAEKTKKTAAPAKVTSKTEDATQKRISRENPPSKPTDPQPAHTKLREAQINSQHEEKNDPAHGNGKLRKTKSGICGIEKE
jgi:hypothetical protein